MSRGSRVIVEANCAEQPAHEGSAQEDEPPSSFGIAQDRAERGEERAAQLQILALTQSKIDACSIELTREGLGPPSTATWLSSPT